MHGKRVLLLGLLVLILSLPSLRFKLIESKASESYPVHNLNTGLNYTAIQDAINANETLDGHTIFVDAGSYNEQVVVNKSISLLGENRDNTILEWKEENETYPWVIATLNITADDVVVSGFSLLGLSSLKMQVSSCSNVTIQDNLIWSMGECILLIDATNCTIEGNTLRGGGLEGNNLLVLWSCTRCVIENNTVEHACYDGILLVASNNNLICNNLISENQYGIDFYNGPIGIDAGNTVFHNNFEGNQHQLSGGTGGNYFNESSEGNYWSDYNGKDVNQDGIGDTPYANLDFCPLAGTFNSFAVLSPTENQSITTISNSTVSNLTVPTWLSSPTDGLQPGQRFIWFFVTGENGSGGFCRLMMPRTVLNSSSYIVLVDSNLVNATELPVSNSTHVYLYFTYTHSTHEVIVTIPEFAPFLMLSLFIIATLLVVIVYKRKHISDRSIKTETEPNR